MLRTLQAKDRQLGRQADGQSRETHITHHERRHRDLNKGKQDTMIKSATDSIALQNIDRLLRSRYQGPSHSATIAE